MDQLDCGGAGQGDGGSYPRVQPRPRHRKERLRCVISSLQGTDCSPATRSDSDYAQYFFSKANEPILSWYIFTFRQLARGSSMSSTHSRVPVRHHRVRAPRPANRTRRVAEAMRTQPLPHRPLVASPLWLSLFVRAEPSRCTWYAHALMPSSCRRWLPTPLDSTKYCLSYTSGWSYGLETMTN